MYIIQMYSTIGKCYTLNMMLRLGQDEVRGIVYKLWPLLSSGLSDKNQNLEHYYTQQLLPGNTYEMMR